MASSVANVIETLVQTLGRWPFIFLVFGTLAIVGVFVSYCLTHLRILVRRRGKETHVQIEPIGTINEVALSEKTIVKSGREIIAIEPPLQEDLKRHRKSR